MKIVMNNRTKAITVLTLVLFAWGIDFVCIEYMMRYMSAGLFAFIRIVIITIVLLILVYKTQGKFLIHKKDLLRVFLAGILATSLYSTFEGIGIGITSASFASLILATVPIFGMLGDRIFYAKKITKVKMTCIIISIVGVYLLVIGDSLNSSLAGLGIMILTAIVWTSQILLTKPLYEKYDLYTILSGMFISGLIFQTPLLLFIDTRFTLTPKGILVVVLSAVFCLMAGEIGYMYAIGNLEVTTVAAFENVLPVVTVIISFFVYGTMLRPLQLIGGLLIVIAVMIIAFKEE